MSDHCPKCQARHIRSVPKHNFAYCGVCDHRWVMDENKPANLQLTVCWNCWGTGQILSDQKNSINCQPCNGSGWLETNVLKNILNGNK